MIRNEVYPYHYLAELEIQYRFLYALRDLGIKSAGHQANVAWTTYMIVVGRITEGG